MDVNEREARARIAYEILESGSPDQIFEWMDRDFHAVKHRKAFPIVVRRLAEEQKYSRQVLDQRDAAMIALTNLTPGGSEYANDIDACVKWVRDRFDRSHEQTKSQVKRRKEVEAECERLKKEIEKLQVVGELKPSNGEDPVCILTPKESYLELLSNHRELKKKVEELENKEKQRLELKHKKMWRGRR